MEKKKENTEPLPVWVEPAENEVKEVENIPEGEPGSPDNDNEVVGS